MYKSRDAQQARVRVEALAEPFVATEGDLYDALRHDRYLGNYFSDPLWGRAGPEHPANFVAVLSAVLHHASSKLEQLIEPANQRTKGYVARGEGTAITEAKVSEEWGYLERELQGDKQISEVKPRKRHESAAIFGRRFYLGGQT